MSGASDEAVRVTRATYDEISETFRRVNAEPLEFVGRQLTAFREKLPAGAVVADVGCGPGRDTALLRARGMRVFGFDLSAGMLRAGGLADMTQADMRALPIRTAALDGIWCQAALLHLPRAMVASALAEFGRVVRSGGGLHLGVTEGDGEGFETDLYDGRPRWFTRHREDQLTDLLGQAGFTVDSVGRASAHREWLALGGTRTAATGG